MNISQPGKQVNYRAFGLIAGAVIVAIAVPMALFRGCGQPQAVAKETAPHIKPTALNVEELAQHPMEIFHAQSTPTPPAPATPRAVPTPCQPCREAINDYLKAVQAPFPDHRNTFEAPMVLGRSGMAPNAYQPFHP